jgi:hypothetical protein
MSVAERSATLACESVVELARAKEGGDAATAVVAALRVKALASARMWEATTTAEYQEVEFVIDEMQETLATTSLAALDAQVLGAARREPLFARDVPALVAPALLLANAGDAELACRRPMATAPKRATTIATSATATTTTMDATNSAPELCCGFPVSEYVTQTGENRGRPYRKCDACGKWKGFSDDNKQRRGQQQVDEDDEGVVRPARAALGQTRRSGSAGKRQIKYPGPSSNKAGSEDEDSPAAELQNRNAPDFQLASKRIKQDDRAGGSYNGGGSGNSNGSASDRGSRSFNPARSVVDAINATDGGSGAVKRKPFSGPARRGEEKDKKSESKKEYDDPIYADERLKTIDPQHVENILSEIMDMGQQITWDDIAGLEFAKNSIKVA